MAVSGTKGISAAQKVKRLLAEKSFPAAVLILCPDNVRKDRIIQLFVEKFTGKKYADAFSSMSLSRCDARELDERALREVRQEAASLSLFSSTRFFIIEHVDELEPEIAAQLLKVLEHTSGGDHFILTAPALVATHVMTKFFTKREALIKLDELQGAELKHWTEREFARVDLQPQSDSVVSILIDIAAGTPDLIVKLIEQLALFISDPDNAARAPSKSVSEDELLNVFSYHPGAGEFQFLDAVTAHENSPRAEFLLRQLMQAGKNPFGLVALATRTFMQLLAIKTLMQENVPPGEIQQRLNLSPWLLKKHLGTVSGYSVSALRAALATLLRLDSKLKNRSLGAEANIGEALWKLRPMRNAA